jgi:isoleucyl-tRNA synthetase
MFHPVSEKFNLPQIEEKILKWWLEKKIFEKSVDNRKGGPRFTLYEGPPTANGRPASITSSPASSKTSSRATRR